MKRFAVAAAAVLALGIVPVGLAGGTLAGRWSTTLTGTTSLHGTLNGTWAIRFAGGFFQTSKHGRPVTHGAYRLKGNVITFIDAPGPYQCRTKGRYRFTVRGKTLTFKRIHDSTAGICIARVTFLKQKFTRV